MPLPLPRIPGGKVHYCIPLDTGETFLLDVAILKKTTYEYVYECLI